MSARHGFTTIELLVTLFIAAMALATGYQLYTTIMREDADTREQARVSQVAAQSIKNYPGSIVDPCVPSTPADNQAITIDTIENPQLTVTVSCPPLLPGGVSRITATITYGTPSKTVTHGTYIIAEAP